MVDGSNKRNKVINLLLAMVLLAWVFGALGLYLFTFNGGLSPNNEDWSYFGSYVGGVVTLPVTVATLVIVYKNYGIHRANLQETLVFNRQNTLLVALNKSIEHLDEALNLTYRNLTGVGNISYVEMFHSEDKFKTFSLEIERNAQKREKALILIGKRFLALYDLLGAYQRDVGNNEIVRSVKIRYQYYYSRIKKDVPLLVENSFVLPSDMCDFFEDLSNSD